ncbi:hypothetical protein H6G33_21270 [Calothrix sp. FACHB-1219]|uniref:hypothetical protein n=1 Tax=unclassified Calothrix TaxID=2619626 RepID=UPI0016890284|nr:MULTISPECIES: hypothetical protein [unclassified Calothrix]MBD2203731.1 hypothetical protein [Calothrix sp. FACHB-168]MBD2219551.1 hypothetical protein [Calothrix sp. FACHB-1219]
MVLYCHIVSKPPYYKHDRTSSAPCHKSDRYNISYIADGYRMKLIDRIASDEVLEQALPRMCDKRAHHHFNSDVWQVRRWWQEKKLRLQQLLRAGSYQFRELRLFWGEDERVE